MDAVFRDRVSLGDSDCRGVVVPGLPGVADADRVERVNLVFGADGATPHVSVSKTGNAVYGSTGPGIDGQPEVQAKTVQWVHTCGKRVRLRQSDTVEARGVGDDAVNPLGPAGLEVEVRFVVRGQREQPALV